MSVIRKLVLGGFVMMAAVALATAIWPSVAVVVTAVLATVITFAVCAPAALGVRWARKELAWRRELRAMPPVVGGTGMPAPVASTLAELRESA